MRVGTLDRLAATGDSWLHRCSPVAKWLVIGAAVCVAVVSRSPWPLAAAYATLAVAVATCRLPLRPFVLGSLLPVPMIGLLALSRWDGTLSTPATLVGKGMVTALAGLLVAATTAYPDLLAPLTRILPRVVADSLVLTYRAIFILWGHVEALWVAIRARGGFFAPPRAGGLPWPARGTTLSRRLSVATTGAALAVLRSADLSARLYDVMRLRGYAGRLAPAHPLRLQRADWRAAALAAAVLVPAVAARAAGR
jgi:energy-coupling factor transporter transmembrane protein EcfT